MLIYKKNMDIKEQKKTIRKMISVEKKKYSMEEKLKLSKMVCDRIEQIEEFQNSNTILMYYSLPDEVQTVEFINKWCGKKRIVLPVVDGVNLILKEYLPDMIEVGYQSILEPTNTKIVNPSEIEFAIIPGVAFDRNKNRLGRGKGFYDRIIPHLKCKMLGLAYGFQMVEQIPLESFDKGLDMLVCESETIL